MLRFPDNSVNLVITSPPYANARKRTYGGVHPDEYIEWFKPIAKEIFRILATDGSLILNLGDNTINGETCLYTFELPIMMKKELGFKFIDPFIWHKTTAPPGKFPNRFKDAWEFCYHFSKNVKIKFNPKNVAQPVSAVSKARYLRHKESHLIKSQTGSGFNHPSGNRRERKNGSAIAGTNDERLFMLQDALPSNVLHFSSEATNVGHPAAFPIELPSFFISALTDEGDLVYDPFMGSGTTAEAAIRSGRKFIGSEINQDYIKVANNRISAIRNNLFT